MPFIHHLRRYSFTTLADVYRCGFDAAAFDDSLFAQFDVDMPSNIQRSAPKRRREYLAGRLCAAAALRDLGVAGSQVGIGSERQPIWPTGLTGSITHSAAEAAAICIPCSQSQGVGVDIEPLIERKRAARIAHAIATADELSLLQAGLPDVSFAGTVTLAFSAKESAYKALFPRVPAERGFHGFRIARLDAALGRMTLATIDTPDMLVDYDLSDGQVLTVALATP